MNRAHKFPYCSSFMLLCCWLLLCLFPPISHWTWRWWCHVFYGKEGIVYGKVGLELVMSQSPQRTSRLHVYKMYGKGAMDRVRGCDTQRAVSIFRRFPGLNRGLLNEMRARWCRRKECRIFFLKCHVVKLWRVLYYFQEERLNSLPFDFFPCLHPSPCCSLCTSGISPLGGDPGQCIG